MIDCYTWPTPNGHKVHIMLEETGLEWTVHPINIQEGDQFKPEFLAISPNNKMPAIIDQDGPGNEPISVFESAAILIYLANKSGKFLPLEPRKYYDTIQWLMFQMGGIGPMLGQAHHFYNYAPQRFDRELLQYGIDRYVNESNRLYGVLDRRLEDREWVAADEYTIADMAMFPWLRYPENQGVDINDYQNVKRWRDKIWARPQVEKALETLAEHRRTAPYSDKAWEVMYGATQRTQGGGAAAATAISETSENAESFESAEPETTEVTESPETAGVAEPSEHAEPHESVAAPEPAESETEDDDTEKPAAE